MIRSRQMRLQLLLRIFDGIEGCFGIEASLIFSMTSLHLPIMTRCRGFDGVKADVQMIQCYFKLCELFALQTIGEFVSIIGLDTFDWKLEEVDTMNQKLGGRMRTMFIEDFEITKAGVLVDGGELIELGAG